MGTLPPAASRGKANPGGGTGAGSGSGSELLQLQPALTCRSERVTVPARSWSCCPRMSCTLCATWAAHGVSCPGPGSSTAASPAPSRSCLRRLEPKRLLLLPTRRSAMAPGSALGRAKLVGTEHHPALLRCGERQQSRTELEVCAGWCAWGWVWQQGERGWPWLHGASQP